MSHGEIKWGLAKIQGIEFEDKYELARNLFLRVERSKQKGHRISGKSSETKSDIIQPDKSTEPEVIPSSSGDEILTRSRSSESPTDSADAGETSPIIPQAQLQPESLAPEESGTRPTAQKRQSEPPVQQRAAAQSATSAIPTVKPSPPIVPLHQK